MTSKVEISLTMPIVTRYHGPTNTRCSRITANTIMDLGRPKGLPSGRLVHSWDPSLNTLRNHEAACAALVEKLGWHGHWIGGEGSEKHNGYIFVCVKRYEVQP